MRGKGWRREKRIVGRIRKEEKEKEEKTRKGRAEIRMPV
jgi:hypothetical protein